MERGGATVRVDTRTSKIVATIPIRLTDHPNLYSGGPTAIVTGGGSVWTSIAGAPR